MLELQSTRDLFKHAREVEFRPVRAYLLRYVCLAAVDYVAEFSEVGFRHSRRGVILNRIRRNMGYNLVLKVRPVVALGQQYDNVVPVLTCRIGREAVAAREEISQVVYARRRLLIAQKRGFMTAN